MSSVQNSPWKDLSNIKNLFKLDFPAAIFERFYFFQSLPLKQKINIVQSTLDPLPHHILDILDHIFFAKMSVKIGLQIFYMKVFPNVCFFSGFSDTSIVISTTITSLFLTFVNVSIEFVKKSFWPANSLDENHAGCSLYYVYLGLHQKELNCKSRWFFAMNCVSLGIYAVWLVTYKVLKNRYLLIFVLIVPVYA